MFKWLGIAVIVLTCILSVLLGLGYLLKENKVNTTILKQQLEQQAYQQQVDHQKKLNRQRLPTNQVLTPIEQSLQKTISANLSCKSNQQCVLFDTGSKALGCTLAVNTKGAAILIKVLSNAKLSSNTCPASELSLTTTCKDQLCLSSNKSTY